MNFLKMPKLSYLKKVLKYNPKTGDLYRKTLKGYKLTGTTNDEGSKIIKIKKKLYKVSRICYYLYYGVDPAGRLIDHINGDNTQNNIKNLRLATSSQNIMNSKLHKNNKSGKKGVCYVASANRWVSYINVEKRRLTLGYYRDKQDAITARKIAEEKYYGEFVRKGV